MLITNSLFPFNAGLSIVNESNESSGSLTEASKNFLSVSSNLLMIVWSVICPVTFIFF